MIEPNRNPRLGMPSRVPYRDNQMVVSELSSAARAKRNPARPRGFLSMRSQTINTPTRTTASMNHPIDFSDISHGRELNRSSRDWNRAWTGRAADHARANEDRIRAVALGLAPPLFSECGPIFACVLRRGLIAHQFAQAEVGS